MLRPLPFVVRVAVLWKASPQRTTLSLGSSRSIESLELLHWFEMKGAANKLREAGHQDEET